MTEQNKTPEEASFNEASFNQSVQPTPAKLRDRRPQPEGVVPKQSQAYVIAGLAVLILLAVLFSNKPKPPAKPSAAITTPLPTEVNRRKIADFTEELNTAQKAGEQAARSASNPSANAQPAGFAVGENSNPAQTIGPQPVASQEAHRDPIADAEREIAFKSRFASNLVSENSGHETKSDTTVEGVPEEGRRASSSGGTPNPSPINTKHSAEINVNSAQGQPFVLFEGTTIDTTLLNRLNGDFSGPVKVMVTNPVYSHDGQRVLIPEGSFLLGDVQKVDSFGQRRLALTFHRLLMPDGYGVDLDRFHGLNQIGETGLADQVNNHYLQIFGTSIALGIISGAAEATTNTSGSSLSGSDSVRQGIAASLSQSGAHVLDRFLNILPTLTIREGHRIKVYLSDDLLLPAYENHTIPPNI